jgi:hypothetical protein
MGRVLPRLTDRFVRATLFEGQKSARKPRPGENRVFEGPSSELHERGNYEGVHVMETSVYTHAATHPRLTRALAAGLLAGVAALAIGRRLA